ncbi:hypothetical protein J4E86_005084 [Alternaria arbusti]|uniref:uncharacterized protein n=1 Tax=Alternaria arbusti TaxID=232088 RepID=UPI00221EE22E|nr:uncharacterized protein J4E86_005084 [Alternaria arbusti]KAI4957944.1 hypothetical protein J4E86_005084 [Alternaria arbusti]
MSQSKITTFANETLDKIFAYLANKDAWLALIKVHNGRCSMLSTALTAAPHLAGSVQTLQIDCQLEGAYPYGKLSLERDAIREILAKIANLQNLTIFILDDPRSTFQQMDASSEIAQM